MKNNLNQIIILTIYIYIYICIYLIGNQHDDQINVLATAGRIVFTACNNVAYANLLGKEVL